MNISSAYSFLHAELSENLEITNSILQGQSCLKSL